MYVAGSNLLLWVVLVAWELSSPRGENTVVGGESDCNGAKVDDI